MSLFVVNEVGPVTDTPGIVLDEDIEGPERGMRDH